MTRNDTHQWVKLQIRSSRKQSSRHETKWTTWKSEQSLFPQAYSMSPELPTYSEIVVGQLLVDGPCQARDLLLNAKSGCQRFVQVASFGVLLERRKLLELILCPILKIFAKLDFHMSVECLDQRSGLKRIRQSWRSAWGRKKICVTL